MKRVQVKFLNVLTLENVKRFILKYIRKCDLILRPKLKCLSGQNKCIISDIDYVLLTATY